MKTSYFNAQIATNSITWLVLNHLYKENLEVCNSALPTNELTVVVFFFFITIEDWRCYACGEKHHPKKRKLSNSPPIKPDQEVVKEQPEKQKEATPGTVVFDPQGYIVSQRACDKHR